MKGTPPHVSRTIPSSQEYSTRTAPDTLELCPNCKDGHLWNRNGLKWCRTCGIEGTGLQGIIYRRETPLSSGAVASGGHGPGPRGGASSDGQHHG